MHKWSSQAWRFFLVFQIVIFLAAAVKPANAYVDPGSGLLFLQVGGSMLAGAMFVLRAKVRKLFRLGNPAQSGTTKKTDAAREAGTEPAE